MDYKKIMIITLCLQMISCASMTGGNSAFSIAISQIQKSMRTPGEKIIDGPNEVWLAHKCNEKNRPFTILEKNVLIPSKIKPGDELNHHLIYAMCPQRPTEVVQGQLFRNILFKGGVIQSDKTNFEMKPGRWQVDAFITVPSEAETGIYALEAIFESQNNVMGRYEVFRNIQTIIVDK